MVPELQLRVRPSSQPSSQRTSECEDAPSPLRGGGGHTVHSPRPLTPANLTLADALRSSRQVSISMTEEHLSALAVDPSATSPSAKSPASSFKSPSKSRSPSGSPSPSPSPSTPRLVTDCGVTSEIGLRPENQDCWILHDRFAGHDGAVFAAVLDGHGPDGRRVAIAVQSLLPERLAAQPELLTDPLSAMRCAFAETQAKLLAPDSGHKTEQSGATATCILLLRKRLIVAKCAPGPGCAVLCPGCAWAWPRLCYAVLCLCLCLRAWPGCAPCSVWARHAVSRSRI
jgi:hypothetical protein